MRALVAFLALLVACKGDKPATTGGSAGSSGSGSGSGEFVRSAVTDDEGRAVLAVTAEYVAALCKCTDKKCLDPVMEKYAGNARLTAQVGTNFNLSQADVNTLLGLKQQQLHCMSAASGVAGDMAKITAEAKANAEEQKQLLTAAIPATTPHGKAYLPKLRDFTKVACECKTTACIEALVEPTEPDEELAIDEMAYALKLTVLYAECGMALVSESIEKGIAPPP